MSNTTPTATPEHVERTSRKNIAAAGGEANSTFLDYRDTRPINSTAAALQGAMGGALSGAMLTGLTAMVMSTIRAERLPDGQPLSVLFSPKEKIAGIAIVAATSVVGAVINAARANTHNKWANQIREQISNPDHTIQRG